MKQYLGISRDHSGSMSSLSRAAMQDYNDTIQAVKTASQQNDIDTIVSVVKHQGDIVREVVNSGIDRLKSLTSYPTPGPDTPLFESVDELINLLSSTPDSNEKDVTFLVIAVTDGQDNSSKPNTRVAGERLGARIRQLQSTDRWTFVFRVPRGYKRALESLGVPSGNIQEWDQTERGLRESSVQTQTAVTNYYTAVKSGVRSTTSFYANLDKVSQNEVASRMTDISSEVRIWPVRGRDMIEPFITRKTGSPYRKGTAFYQLSKTEKAVQDYKLIVVRNRNTGAVYAGQSARDLLNLPTTGTIRLVPGDHGDWDIFIQSTSTNRVLLPGTSVLYWDRIQ